MDLGIKGRVALVTGAGRGLGRAVALSLAGAGARVLAVSRTVAPLKTLLQELPCAELEHRSLSIDLNSDGAADSVLGFLHKEKLSPDIIVHNAGGSCGVTSHLAPASDWQRVWQLNLGVAIDINRALAPAMQEKRWGRIVHISSVSAENYSGYPPYVAAKGAVNAYIKSMSRILAPHGVILSAMAPGPINMEGRYFSRLREEDPAKLEEFYDHHLAIRRLGEPTELAQAVLFLCSQHAAYAAGSIFGVDGGSH